MLIRRPKFSSALTLIEVMVAMVVLAIASLGALRYQYYAAKQARLASIQMASTHIGHLLLEDWKSTGGSEEYAENGPINLGLGFTKAVDIPNISYSEGMPGNMTEYSISVDDIPMLAILGWGNVAFDAAAQVTLRQLVVRIYGGVVNQDLNEGEIVSEQVSADNSASGIGPIELITPVTLTTYVRLDASGG
ncbi:prepilin-type N-terminal cleavage/methylation domain-containing protein [Planctomycetota bacterium]